MRVEARSCDSHSWDLKRYQRVISISNGPWAHVALESCVIFGKIYIYLLSNVRKGMWRERNFFTLRKDVDMVHFEP